MIARTFTQADLGGAAQVVLPAMAPGGVYLLALGGFVTSGAGAGGTGYIRATWTDAEGQPQQLQTTFWADDNVQQPNQVLALATVAHPSDIEVRIVNASAATEMYSVEARVFVARVREEGNA